MINTYTYKDETWIDVNSGTAEEMHSLMEKYRLHPFVAHELSTLSIRPRIELHNDYIYCILHFPVWKHTHNKENTNQEVDFIIGKNILITTRYDTIDSLHKFAKTLEVKQVITHADTPSEFIFISLLRELYTGLSDELSAIEDTIEDVTGKIFLGQERQMVVSISQITRTLLEFKKVTNLHYEILEKLFHLGKKTFGDTFGHEMETVILEYQKINATIQSNLDMLAELRQTNNSLLTTKQNETVKNLTVMGFMMLPLNLIAWIFAMRTDGMPLIDNPNGFWIVIGMMLTSVVITFFYARHKQWL